MRSGAGAAGARRADGENRVTMSSALLPKPQMRRLLARRMKFHLFGAFFVSIGCAALYKFGIAEPRKRAYAEFYKNYDAMKDFEAMKAAGVFECAPPK